MDVNVLLFDDFETLDTFGAVEEYRLRYFSVNGSIILSKQGTKITTEQLKGADFLGILLVPGGQIQISTTLKYFRRSIKLLKNKKDTINNELFILSFVKSM
ncbi:hypothetical protein LL033_25290 (plasmid) [Clostridium estertheticum]|uniref:hypothetical protein n=1 Tax=Clostridium estertheticum TaxID=238834 RepID=UPI001C0DD411|nr:hypothetical protein [Clostridium estertheticum]MBU3217213.1 hypothetical protein [Clostridium estertheticum]WAG58075.1 hypothetical protein LL033_25290 [Clostridium estertheticum]